MKKTIIILLSMFFIVAFGIYLAVRLYDNNEEKEYNTVFDNNIIIQQEKIEVKALESSSVEEEKTTPNTLIIFKTYYTKCKHYIQEYKDIDASMVNLSKEKLKERCREWEIIKFSSEEIELTREKEEFCGEHYKLKLENSVIVIYTIDENGIESEYEQTGITTEYLTEEDILKLSAGIMVYGKEKLSYTIEDFE